MKNIKQHMTGGNILLFLLTLVLVFGSFSMIGAHVLPPGFNELGLTLNTMQLLGSIKLLSALGLWLPRTKYISALVLTGYLGGAMMACLVIGSGFMIPGIFILILWAGMEKTTGNFLHIK